MHPFFDITPLHIAELNDGQARELVARLCRFHLRQAGMDTGCVRWPGDQRAPDGGIDVELDALPACDLPRPVRRSVAIFQVKAEPFAANKIKNEMAPKGVLRPAIAGLAVHDGAYLIASTRSNPAPPERQKRVAAMEQVLSEHGLSGKIEVDFLGQREIADWVEQFPPLAIWVRRAINKPLVGWQGYGPWAYQEDDPQAEFVQSDKFRVFPPGATDAVTDTQGINAIRADLLAGKSVRLVGLSGVGKTRLAQALFDPRIETAKQAMSADLAVYTDISARPDPSPETMVEALRSSGQPAVIIVDNCGQETHSALVAAKGRHAGGLGLLTIEYDIRDDIPNDTQCYRLEGTSEEVLWSVLRAHYRILSSPDLSTVIAASEGNARLAFAIASTAQQTGDLAQLRNDELFRRLFEQKHGNASDELLRCAQAASLIYSFDGEDLSVGSEIALLATFARVSAQAFRSNLAEIKRRGLLQERGKMRALLPHAVSNRLAARALEEFSADELDAKLFHGELPRVRTSFANRLSYLHGSMEARALVARWLAPGAPLGMLASLSDQDFHLFQRLAPVDQATTLAAIERSVAPEIVGRLDEFRIDKLAWIAHSLAFETVYFDRCVDVLVELAKRQAVNRSGREKQPEHLVALFQAYGSGTLAPPSQRAPHVERLLASDNATERDIGVALLAETLKVRGFRSHSTFQFGARTRTQGRRAKDEAEHCHWYETFLAIAEPLALQDNEIGKTLRAALAKTVDGFVYVPSLLQHLERLAPEFLRIDGWLPSLQAVRRLLRNKELRDEPSARAKAFEQRVTPQGLRAQVLAAIAMRDPYDYAKLRDDGPDVYERMAVNSQALGEQLAGEPLLLQELLPRLLEGEIYREAFHIGKGVALGTADAQPLFDAVRAVIQAASERDACNVTFACGLMLGWHERDLALASRLLDAALGDPILAPWFPALQLQVPLDTAAAARLVAAIATERAALGAYQALGFALKALDLTDVASVLNALLTKGAEESYLAIDALAHVVYGARDHSLEWQDTMATFCRDFMVRAQWPAIHDTSVGLSHDMEQIIGFGVKHSRSFKDVRALLKRIEDHRSESSGYVPSDSGNYLAPILCRYPADTLSALNRRRSVERRHRVDEMVLGAWHTDHMGAPKPVMAPETLVEWCAADPSARIAFVSRICPLDLPAEGQPSVVAQLYGLAPDKDAFIQAVLGRCMRATTSSEDLPNLNAGIQLFERLPLASGSAEAAQRDKAVQDLRDRITWWNQMLGRTGRERDEGFE